MKRKVIFLLLTLILSQWDSLFAINDTIRIKDYSYKEGLNSFGVNSVFKDSKGFLWICTTNGLYRYDGYSFKNINTIASGTLKYETYCIVEDKNQNFWIGTAGEGIVYYNSHTGKLFGLKLSEGNNSKVNRIVFFQKRIWIATNQGLLVIDEKENIDVNTFFNVKILWPDPLHKNLQTNVINFIYSQPGRKSLWIGTNSPLYELDPESYQFKIINSYNQNSIRWLADYTNGNILASSWDGGVFVVNPTKHSLENDFSILEINKIIGDKRIKSAVLDRQNRYWIATFGEGLYIFDKNKDGSIKYENYRNEKKLPIRLKSNFIDQIFIDGSCTAWLSMSESGLSKIYYQKDYFHYFNFFGSGDTTKSKEIHAIKQSSDRNKFWVSFNRNELDLFDSKNNSYRQFTSVSSGLQLQKDKINFAYQDKKGNLWIIYSRIGIYVVPSKSALSLVEGISEGTIKPIDINALFSSDPRENSYITNFFEDSKERLWIAGWESTYVLQFSNGFLNSKSSEQLIANSKIDQIFSAMNKEQYMFTISPVNSMVEMGENIYWLGTRNGGIIEIEELLNQKFVGKALELNDKLPSNYINCFYLDKNHTLWIGTNSGLCYRTFNSQQLINVKNGLSYESINSITEDSNHNIWVSTSYGIFKIDSKDLSILNFYNSDNEKLNQFISRAVAVTSNGNIWFSTNESLVTFNPNSVENLQFYAPVYFTDIRINNQSITPNEKYKGVQIIDDEINQSKFINVPYGSTLNVEFAALNFVNPEKILYKYKLVANDKDWIILNPGQRSLNLPNMNAGEYTLCVMVANSSDIKEYRSIKINYLPPFWRSKIGYFIISIIGLMLLLLYRKYLIQRTLQKALFEKERYERKIIEELDKMKSEFFSNISHEFRTPLSLIINPLEVLVNEDHLSNKDRNRIRLVLKSSNRLLKLTNELMDFSKIENELLKPDFQLCEIVSMTNEIGHLFNNMIDSMNIDFKINCSHDRIELPVDKKMVDKIIFNLLSNAFKYTSVHGVIMIDLSKHRESEIEYVKISVTNTGEGISKEHLSKIFDRYFQVNNVQNKKNEGTGIGLALVKSFVELHNGKVEVKSERDVETCFEIYLPVIQPNFKNNNESQEIPKSSFKDIKLTQENEVHSVKQNSGYHILLVEDEEDIRNYIIEELSSDYKVLFARNGEEGLKMANETIPDLIITDVKMPVLSGIELCKKLKNQLVTSHIPIIILSAKAGIDQQVNGLEMGADVYMIKPFNIEILKVQIQSLIRFKQAIYSKYLKETTLIPQSIGTNKLDDDFMKKVLSFIEENLTKSDLNVDQLANCVSLSKVQTYRKIKAFSGLSIVEFIRTVRLKKAADLILESRLNFCEIAFTTGFSTPSYFSKCFHDHFGKTPSEFASDYGKELVIP